MQEHLPDFKPPKMHLIIDLVLKLIKKKRYSVLLKVHLITQMSPYTTAVEQVCTGQQGKGPKCRQPGRSEQVYW